MLNAKTLPQGEVHATALVDGSAVIGEGVTISPYAVIGPNVVIGEGTRIGSHALIERDTEIGRECRIHHGAVLGTAPQDVKYRDEPTQLVVGDRTVVREYATVNRGTSATGRTAVGSDCMVMAYAHVAHDCVIGNHVVLSNAVNMGGHVEIEDWVTVGGVTPIHQFVRIGCHAFVGGASRVQKDVPPFVRVSGNPVALFGLNTVGLRRRGFSDEVRAELKRLYRLLFKSTLNVSQAVDRARSELTMYDEVERFLTFVASSRRGIVLDAGPTEDQWHED